MSSIIYNKFMSEKAIGNIDWINDNYKVGLILATYTPDPEDEHWDEISSLQVTAGLGYTSGGATIPTGAGRTVSMVDNMVKYDADNIVWAASTINSARYAVIYKSTGDSATSVLVACFDMGTYKSSDNQDFQIEWNPFGIVTEEQAV